MTLPAIAQYVRRMVGLDEAALGAGVLERSVRRRLVATDTPDYVAYLKVLEQSAEELQKLINDVTVPETSFFRDPGVFRALTEVIAAEWLPTPFRRTLRILSVPCSTGEEPYSIAMALLDAGLSSDRFSIDAIDINQRVLAIARRGVYGGGSFRGRELAFRDRYFHRTAQGWELDAQVRESVHLRHGNLLDPQLTTQTYDVVFCRNLLIYFDAQTQLEAMRRLDALVAPDGLLFLGSAETFLTRGTAFRSLGRPMSFGFRRSGMPTEAPARVRGARKRPGPIEPAQSPAPRRRSARPVRTAQRNTYAQTSSTQTTFSVSERTDAAPDVLDQAEALANSGRLSEAADMCRDYVERNGPNARAYFLLGVACDALGDGSEALSYFRKVVYLEPGHEQALMHLALLSRRKGATDQALQLERRARTFGRNEGEV